VIYKKGVVFVVFVLFFLINSFSVDADLTCSPNLVLYYAMDDNIVDGIDDVIDYSGNGNDGSCGFPGSCPVRTFDQSLNPDEAYLFDGTGPYISAPDSATLDVSTNDMAMYALVRLDSLPENSAKIITKSHFDDTIHTDIGVVNDDITFFGRDSNDFSGSAVGSGDFNNDGIDDVIIGASFAEGEGPTIDDEGEVYIIHGPRTEASGTNLDLDLVPDSVLYGTNADDHGGSGVGSLYYDSDGNLDVIIGAHNDELPADGVGNNRGMVYVKFGSFGASVGLDSAERQFSGINDGDEAGWSVGSGDFNNDGQDDLIIGARFAEPAVGGTDNRGEVYIFTSPLPSTSPIGLDTADITFTGRLPNDWAGGSVGSGDFNNDGIDDVIIGAYGTERDGEDNDIQRGAVYIKYGPVSSGQSFTLDQTDSSEVDVVIYGLNEQDQLGHAVGSGDFNKDGIDDVIVGAAFAEGVGSTSSNEGEVYIVYGPFGVSGGAVPILIDLDPAVNTGVNFYGIVANDNNGKGVASGDFNNDGIDDVLTSAWRADNPSGDEGETYLKYGPFDLVENYNLMINSKGEAVASYLSGGTSYSLVGGSLSIRAWTIIVATLNFTANEMKLYVGDVATVSTLSIVSPMEENAFDLVIGAFEDGVGANFTGAIDEISIWNFVQDPVPIFGGSCLNSICGDALISTCSVPADCTRATEFCINGYCVEHGENCDDGGTVPGDGCDENCVLEVCGNGVLQVNAVPPEQCDDGCLQGIPGVCEVGIDDGDTCDYLCQDEIIECLTCDDCDDLFGSCDQNICVNFCPNPGSCYYKGVLIGQEDCGFCLDVTSCSVYNNELDCNDDPCAVLFNPGRDTSEIGLVCTWDAGNCVPDTTCIWDCNGIYGACQGDGIKRKSQGTMTTCELWGTCPGGSTPECKIGEDTCPVGATCVDLVPGATCNNPATNYPETLACNLFEKSFPIFTWLNMFISIILISGYYLYRKNKN